MRTMDSVRYAALLAIVAVATGCNDKTADCPSCPQQDLALVAATRYIEDHRTELGLRDNRDQMKVYRVSHDALNMSHVRFYQHFLGVQVDGGELIVHLDSLLEVVSVSGETIRDVTIDIMAHISASEASNMASVDFAASGHAAEQEGSALLEILRVEAIDHLCWVMILHAADGLDRLEYFVDAHDGAIVYRRDLVVS